MFRHQIPTSSLRPDALLPRTLAPRCAKASPALALLCAGTCAPSAFAFTNLLANGGFESGSVTGQPDGKGLVPLPWRTNAASGGGLSSRGPYDTWSNVAHAGLDPATNTGLFPFAITAPEGIRFAGGLRSGTLSQRLSAPLVPGALYDISALLHATHPGAGFGGFDFALTDRSPHSSGQTNLVATTSPVFYSQGWVLFSASFIAPAGAATMRDFDIRGSLGLSSEYMCLDDVRLSQAPSPGGAALLALAAMAGVRRRRP